MLIFVFKTTTVSVCSDQIAKKIMELECNGLNVFNTCLRNKQTGEC